MKRPTLAAALLVALAIALACPAWAHDVKDPVCRMTVDSDTTRYKVKLGGKTFYFCSTKCQSRFRAAPAKYDKLAALLEKSDPHEYSAELTTEGEPVAGQPVRLAVALRYADSKALVKEYEIVHERLLHLVMVSEDLAWFEHQHPVRGADGLFRLTWTFPRPGNYRLYADFTPADGDNQVLPMPLVVAGGTPTARPLIPDQRLKRQVGGLRFELQVRPGTPLRREKPVLFTYVIRDTRGRPVHDIQPFIGAMGHLLAISSDGREVIHTHVVQTATPAGTREPLRVAPEMVTESGPRFTFKVTLPTAGLYKTWAQFQRGGKVYTVPFTFSVQDLWAPSASATPGPPATTGGR